MRIQTLLYPRQLTCKTKTGKYRCVALGKQFKGRYSSDKYKWTWYQEVFVPKLHQTMTVQVKNLYMEN